VRKVRAGGCARCGYALRGVPVTEGRAECPECGEVFVPALLTLGAVAGRRLSGGPRSYAGLWLVGTLAVALLVVFAWLAW
jgi:hypothetical protein